MSFNQKGFLPHDGVFENNYVLEQVMKKHKIKKKDLFMASIDLSNAFGSLPHWVKFEALRLAGVGEDFIMIIKDLYTNAVTQYNTSASISTPVWLPPGSSRATPSAGCYSSLPLIFC